MEIISHNSEVRIFVKTIERMPKVRGSLMKIFDPIQVTKEFKRRNIVVEVSGEMGRTELISMELFQDHCKVVDKFNEGDRVVVDFNIKGRKWVDAEGVDKYFNTLQAWKIVIDKNPDDN